MPARITCHDERGLALLVTMLMIVVLSALALMGLSMAHGEQEIATRNHSTATAFYAAEAGLVLTMDNWAGAAAATTAPGEQKVIRQGTLAGGFSYQGVVTRLDDGSSIHPLYALRVEATRGGYSGRAGLLVTSVPLEIPFNFALRVRGATRLRGNAVIDGQDRIPASLATECPTPVDSRPGIITNDAALLDIEGTVDVLGEPSILENPDTTEAGFFDFGGMTFDDLAAKANFSLPTGTVLSGSNPAPKLTGEGACDISDPGNWGDPTNLGQPCSSWFPIIYAEGNLKLSGSGLGQGILIVEGDLDLSGGVEFYGPVIVKGKLKSTGGGFHIYGGLISGETDINDESFLGGNSKVAFSSCSLRRAVSHSDAASPKALSDRPWFQTR